MAISSSVVTDWSFAIGALFTLFTVIVIASESFKLPSVTTKVMLCVPTCSKVGVQENAPVDALRLAPAGSLSAEYVSGSPSASVADMVNDNKEFSLTDLFPIAPSTGALFTLFTVMVISSKSISIPSVTWKCTPAYVPAWL